MTNSGELIEFPIGPVPEPSDDPVIDEIELAIIRAAAVGQHEQHLQGLAQARQIYLRTRAVTDRDDDPHRFVCSVLAAIRRLPECARGRIRHPAYSNRHRVQSLLREECP